MRCSAFSATGVYQSAGSTLCHHDCSPLLRVQVTRNIVGTAHFHGDDFHRQHRNRKSHDVIKIFCVNLPPIKSNFFLTTVNTQNYFFLCTV